jgi:hypothetical protein
MTTRKARAKAAGREFTAPSFHKIVKGWGTCGEGDDKKGKGKGGLLG